MPDKPSYNELHLGVREVETDAIPRAVRERLRDLAPVIGEPGVLTGPALRDERLGLRPVERAVADGVDGYADGCATGQHLAVDHGPVGRDNAMVRLRRGRVHAEALLDASEEILAFIHGGDGDFIRVAEPRPDLRLQLL